MNLEGLIRLCNRFYKKANLEGDMAKRIMYSIIPSVMTATERQSTMIDPIYWGIDYRALKSAAGGANDLIKYGTSACVEELTFYKKYDVNVAFKVKTLAEEGSYIEALNIAEKAFLDVNNWDTSYGREPWAKIARVLKQLTEKRDFLKMVQEEVRSNKGEPNTNYQALEIETMKEMIVLMNVFDGLAHNGGNILPKLMHEESKITEFYDSQAQGRVQRMMDAKELNNPVEVYREIQPIIDNPIFKSTFGDWISRIRRSPEYNTPEDYENKKKELDRIRTKKNLKDYVALMESTVYSMIAVKDKIINSKNDWERRYLYTDAIAKIGNLRTNFTDAMAYTEGFIYTLNRNIEQGIVPDPELLSYYKEIFDYGIKAKISLTEIYNKHYHAKFDEQELISIIHQAKRIVSGFESVAANL